MKLHEVSAFAGDNRRPARGNRAAVALVDAFAPDEELTRIATDLALPGTVFVKRGVSGAPHHVRWFTPQESDFCGHGTLAAAHVLFGHEADDGRGVIHFTSRAGALAATRRDGGSIELDLPALALTPIDAVPALERALGASPVAVIDAQGRVIVELASEEVVRALTPDIAALRRIFGCAVVVTARGAAPFDIVSRYFRKAGPPEDPVTGSAHCALAPYWAPKLGKSELLAFQASPEGGVLRLVLEGDRVRVAGRVADAAAKRASTRG